MARPRKKEGRRPSRVPKFIPTTPAVYEGL
jgi:hypothetical protein